MSAPLPPFDPDVERVDGPREGHGPDPRGWTRRRRLRHRLTGHPAESTWAGDFTAGCLACGAVWDNGEVR